MKKRVKILILIFILSLFAVLLSGCNSFGGNDGGVTSESSTEEIELKNDPILLNGDTPYCIVRASKAEKEVISAASGLCNRLEKIAGRSVIKIIDDWVMEPEEADNDNFEILVGMTNRPESETAKRLSEHILITPSLLSGIRSAFMRTTHQGLKKPSIGFLTA